MKLVFNVCPACHRPFASSETERELVGSQKVNVPRTNIGSRGNTYNTPFFEKITQTYKVTYKCKHCGQMWQDLVEKSL